MAQLAAKTGDRLGRLETFPRATLAHLPTPLEAMENLAREIGGPRLFVKRDDCTGLALGGNKVRQLEFYLGDARAKGADTILITGAVQSNYVRSAAAAARKLGLDCHIQLEERVAKNDPAYRTSGNVLLDRLLGATLHAYPRGEDEAGADRRLEDSAAELAGQGRRPYVIHLSPGHPPLGALGYVVAAREIVEQAAAQGVTLDEIYVASGSGHTHAGLLVGLCALGQSVRVTGVCVRRDAKAQVPRVWARCIEISELLQIEQPVEEFDIRVVDDVLAPGYGELNEATLGAMQRAARAEGLILDPVYSGKVMAGFLAGAEAAAPGRNLLFIHTGGTPALFAYEPSLTESLT